MKIAIMGCSKISVRIADGIRYSKGELIGIASRDIVRAKTFAMAHGIPRAMTYEECLNDPQIDLVYIAAANTLHYSLTKQCLEHHKHVICEKPFVATTAQLHELFSLAREKRCFLMEAHKTCLTPLNQLLLKRVGEIGPIRRIQAQYCFHFDEAVMPDWRAEATMGGSLYDVGVYPLCFANLYSQSPIVWAEVDAPPYPGRECDFACSASIRYENGIMAQIRGGWLEQEVNKGIIFGERGRIEVIDFWKNTEALLEVNSRTETVRTEQKSDFTGEIDHAIECIEKGLLESPVISEYFSSQILAVCEKGKYKK